MATAAVDFSDHATQINPFDAYRHPLGLHSIRVMNMLLTAGARLGSHEVVSGFMGAVYRALDTRLDRIAAIMVLPLHIAGDALRCRPS